MAQLPPHSRYVEASAGAASVLLNRPRAPSEWLIERDPAQAALLRVVRDRGGELAGRLARFRPGREMFEESKERLHRGGWADDLDLAGLVYVRRQLSWEGHGRIYSCRSRRDLPGWWSRRVGVLPAIGARLRGVEIVEGDAPEWLPLLEGADTLSYCDPPYLWSTRTEVRPYRRHEMDEAAHRRLLGVVDGLVGGVVLSGYPSPLYDGLLAGWSRATLAAPRHPSSRGRRPIPTEVLWMSRGR